MAMTLRSAASHNRVMGHPLEVHLLGRFAVLRGGAEVPATAFGGRKARRLVRVLAMRRGAVVPQDRLVDALWGEAPPADPAGNLSVLVTRVRTAVGDREWISTSAGGYALTGPCTVDAEEFAAAAALARERQAAGDPRAGLAACRAALAHWSGEPMPEDDEEEWATAWRADLLRRHQEVLEAAAALALELDEPTLALEYADAAIAGDRFRESGYLTSARAMARSGAAAVTGRVTPEGGATASSSRRRPSASGDGYRPSSSARSRVRRASTSSAAAAAPDRARARAEVRYPDSRNRSAAIAASAYSRARVGSPTSSASAAAASRTSW